MEGISMEKEECREPPKRAPNPFRVLNLSGKLGFLIGGITFTVSFLYSASKRQEPRFKSQESRVKSNYTHNYKY